MIQCHDVSIYYTRWLGLTAIVGIDCWGFSVARVLLINRCEILSCHCVTFDFSKLRASATFSSMSNSAELKGIESEYIKNLQQQVYFLELEANYLREQARKATEMHPVMTSEAERMLDKLRVR